MKQIKQRALTLRFLWRRHCNDDSCDVSMVRLSFCYKKYGTRFLGRYGYGTLVRCLNVHTIQFSLFSPCLARVIRTLMSGMEAAKMTTRSSKFNATVNNRKRKKQHNISTYLHTKRTYVPYYASKLRYIMTVATR